MPRVKRGKTANKRRRNLLKEAKGFRWGRSTKYKEAKQALFKAWSYAYRDRRTKKREMRRLWNVKINAACRKNGTTYSKLIEAMKKKEIALDRKVLSQIAVSHPDIFSKVVEESLNS